MERIYTLYEAVPVVRLVNLVYFYVTFEAWPSPPKRSSRSIGGWRAIANRVLPFHRKLSAE